MNIKAREQLAEILKKLVTDPEESGLTLCPAGEARDEEESVKGAEGPCVALDGRR